MTAETLALHVEKLTPHIGAEVKGIDLLKPLLEPHAPSSVPSGSTSDTER